MVYKPSSCNLVAYGLAAFRAKLCPGTNPITDSIPACTSVFVANDLALSLSNGDRFHVKKTNLLNLVKMGRYGQDSEFCWYKSAMGSS